MDDDLNNSTPTDNSADDSTPSGSTPDGSGSNGANDPQQPAENSPEENNQAGEAPEQTPALQQNISEEQTSVSAPTQNSFIKNLLAKAGEKIQSNKNKKLDKIMELARQKGSVDNSDVEKILRVSDSTASRYLNQLIKENKLKRSGSPEKPNYKPV